MCFGVEEGVVVCLFGDAIRATKSSPDIKVMAMIRTVADRQVANDVQSSAFQCAVRRAVYERLQHAHFETDVAIRAIDVPESTVPVAKLAKKKVVKCFFENAQLDSYRHDANRAIICHNGNM